MFLFSYNFVLLNEIVCVGIMRMPVGLIDACYSLIYLNFILYFIQTYIFILLKLKIKEQF
jgi:hypothetical protein